MKVRFSLYTNLFMHNGMKHMATCFMVANEGDIVGSIQVDGYLTDRENTMSRAMNIARAVDQQKRLLEELGHDVETDEVFKSSLSICDALEKAYDQEVM